MRPWPCVPVPALAALVAALAWAAPASADALDDVVAAISAFRGIGLPDVPEYRVPFRLPDEGEGPVALEEIWRAPATFAIRSERRVPLATVRSYAIFLEPLYVARSTALDAELGEAVARVRRVARVETKPAENGARDVSVALPMPADTTLPGFLREISRLEARLSGDGRLRRLRLEFPTGPGRRVPETLGVDCSWEDARAPQPSRCTWTLPDGGEVRVTTRFRTEGNRRVPASRHVVFPSRYDPGETEEIRIEYGTYRWDVPAGAFESAGTFRYDASGLAPSP
jgi:hypothetical protein